MIYELRIYHAVEGRLPDVIARFQNHILKLWDKHGIRQAGFWATLVGTSNQQLSYMLAWESLAEREKRWTAFVTDPAWIAVAAETEKNGPIVKNISNEFLVPTAFSSVK
jgi:NIPSNAP